MNRFNFCLLAFAFCLVYAQSNYVFGPSIRVNDDPPGTRFHVTGSSGQHLIGCRGDTVYLVWADERTNLRRIYFSRSTDGGNTWSANLRLSSDDPNHEGYNPSLTLDEIGNIYVCYAHANLSTFNLGVYFTKSTDGGLSFGQDIKVTDDTSHGKVYVSVCTDESENVYVVWFDMRQFAQYGYDIYFSFSSDGGNTFSPNVRVNDLGGIIDAWDWCPTITVNDGNNVFIA